MTKSRFYNLRQAAAFMGVSYQAVQSRFVNEYSAQDANGRHRWLIPHTALRQWQKERQTRARKLLSLGAQQEAK